jgi:hypothetical protein
VSISVDILLRLGCDLLSLPEGGKNLDPGLSSLLLSGGTLSDVFTLNWTGLSGLLTIFGGRFSNYEMWLVDPVRVKPAAQIVYGSKALLQDTVNGETGGGSSAIRITTGIFSTWRAAVIGLGSLAWAGHLGLAVTACTSGTTPSA